jgi:hypothetical protein
LVRQSREMPLTMRVMLLRERGKCSLEVLLHLSALRSQCAGEAGEGRAGRHFSEFRVHVPSGSGQGGVRVARQLCGAVCSFWRHEFSIPLLSV